MPKFKATEEHKEILNNLNLMLPTDPPYTYKGAISVPQLRSCIWHWCNNGKLLGIFKTVIHKELLFIIRVE